MRHLFGFSVRARLTLIPTFALSVALGLGMLSLPVLADADIESSSGMERMATTPLGETSFTRTVSPWRSVAGVAFTLSATVGEPEQPLGGQTTVSFVLKNTSSSTTAENVEVAVTVPNGLSVQGGQADGSYGSGTRH
jgi:hypothetical protein